MPSYLKGRTAKLSTLAKQRLSESPAIRSAALRFLSLGRDPARRGNRIVCLMYHSVRPAARISFAHQLRYLRSLGDFISAGQMVKTLERPDQIDGRYFCITFDDGELNAFNNGFSLLAESGVPSTFFIVPSWVAVDTESENERRRYMSWDECRALVENGGTIGSHTFSHRRLALLSGQEVANELITSRLTLERELGRPCEHLACPWGQPNGDYRVDREPALAAAAGYRSFFTTIRGSAIAGTSPWAIPRIRLEPEWEIHQLRYLLAR